MKKLIVLFTFCGVFISNAQSTRSKLPVIAIKNNVLSYMVVTINLSLEYRISGRHSLQGVWQISKPRNRYSSWFTTNGDVMLTEGYSAGLEYRYYTNPDADIISGFYVSPYFRYFYRDISYDPDDNNPPHSGPYGSVSFKRDVFSYGLMIGIQKISRYGIGYDFYFGFGARDYEDYNVEYSIGEPYQINQFIDDKGELRFGLNILFTTSRL